MSLVNLDSLFATFTREPWNVWRDQGQGKYLIYTGDSAAFAIEHIGSVPADRPDVAAKIIAAPQLFTALVIAAKQIASNLKSAAPNANSREVFMKTCVALGEAFSGSGKSGEWTIRADSKLHGEFTILERGNGICRVAGGLGAYSEGCCESESNARLIAAAPALDAAAVGLVDTFTVKRGVSPDPNGSGDEVVSRSIINSISDAMSGASQAIRDADEPQEDIAQEHERPAYRF